MDFKLTYQQFSECSILVQWPPEINENILEDVLRFKNLIENLGVKSIVQVNSSYNSLLVIYVQSIDKINDPVLALKTLYLNCEKTPKQKTKHWKIPVCYDTTFGLDLESISEHKQQSKLDIIRLHSEALYTVYFIGFLPGFLYLGGLDKRLYVPRKKHPRRAVKKGAVAIGGEQTGVYPNSSPGGWNIIGNSPINFFNPNTKHPCFAKAGDTIAFVPINKYQHEEIIFKVTKGIYNIESEVFND